MIPKSSIGRRKCLELFKSVRATVGAGSGVETQVRLRTVYGSIEPLQGRRLIEAEQIAEGVTHKVKSTFFEPKPTNVNYFVFDGRRFDIQAVINELEDNFNYTFYCKERTP